MTPSWGQNRDLRMPGLRESFPLVFDHLDRWLILLQMNFHERIACAPGCSLLVVSPAAVRVDKWASHVDCGCSASSFLNAVLSPCTWSATAFETRYVWDYRCRRFCRLVRTTICRGPCIRRNAHVYFQLQQLLYICCQWSIAHPY